MPKRTERNPPKSEETQTSINLLTKTADCWLKSKRGKDGAEGLWRIHDSLYDVTDFIQTHPGGQFWLESTKGSDVTEAFECHHISTLPETILKQYYVRKASTPRNSSYTFEDSGFYRTLKRRVREALKIIPKEDSKLSDMYTDSLLIGAFAFAILANIFWSYKLAILSGILCSLTIIAGHNYCHKRDNFRMLYIDACMLNSREFRIIHVLSHHFYPNTTADIQAFFGEPFIVPFPQKKSFMVKYGSWIYGPLLFWPLAFHVATILRILGWLYEGRTHKLEISEFFPLSMPLIMYLIGGQPLLATIGLWQLIIVAAAFSFSSIAFTNSHVHPEVFIDGDTPRAKEEKDWGINQLDTVCDRYEFTGNKFLVLVGFGDHALHHLFPTLDHSILHHLYPLVKETTKEFSLDIRMTTQVDMFLGYFRQLAREKGNPYPPNLIKTF